MSMMESRSADASHGQDRFIQDFLSRVPNDVAESFDERQLSYIKTVFGARTWGVHSVDMRGTFWIPMRRKRYYFVFLFGKNKRQLSKAEKQASLIATAVLIMMGCLLVLLVLYLLKSAMGVDLFPNFSLGIWTWFKANVF